ncbi:MULTISPECIES: DUF202 domain-containing protein [unclassified Frankia]|uniref:DUF202 domain-containing protein n=1 Tax=unclassified Frankia TaxID=2632575 RepID=UPI002024E623
MSPADGGATPGGPRACGDRLMVPDRAAGETQPERTYLAWQRTGFAFVGLGALLLHVSCGHGNRPLGCTAGAWALSAGAAAWLTGSRRHHQDMADVSSRRASPAGALRCVALAAVVSGLAALALVLS